MTVERRYKDGFTDYVETEYGYADNVPGRVPQLSGVYLTSKVTEGVRDADSALLDGMPTQTDLATS